MRKTMVAWVCAGMLGAMVSSAAPSAVGSEVEVRVEEHAGGARVLVHEVVVPAPLAEVWAAFTTADGWMSWAVPFAHMDFRLGGEIESSYHLSAKKGDAGNIKNRILAFVPQRMIALQAVAAPPGFPHPEVLAELFSVIELEAVDGGHTRVRMAGVGYRDDPRHAEILEKFRGANRWSLEQLVRRFREGPVDWPKRLGGAPR